MNAMPPPVSPHDVARDLAPAASATTPGQDRQASFEDVPSGIWTIYLFVWVGFFGMLWLLFGGTGDSAFMVTISTLFGIVTFSLPFVIHHFQRRGRPVRHDGLLRTFSGDLPMKEAAIQILSIPVAVVTVLVALVFIA